MNLKRKYKRKSHLYFTSELFDFIRYKFFSVLFGNGHEITVILRFQMKDNKVFNLLN